MNVEVIPTRSLYKWAKNFKRVQDRFYDNQFKLRRLQQIEDFIILNNFKKVFHIEEVHLDIDNPQIQFISDMDLADIILVTHQGYSRYPCDGIIKQIEKWLEKCDYLYLCLNRHYLNIDNQKINLLLPNDYLPAITSWLEQSLPYHSVVDLSRNYLDEGKHFTWSIPDRHYYITK